MLGSLNVWEITVRVVRGLGDCGGGGEGWRGGGLFEHEDHRL